MLAYFGYPRAHEDDAERAARAGLELVRAVGALRPRAGLTLRVRVGIATGLVVVGELIGAGAAREEAVVGETPNLAARLQALAEPDTVIIGPTTRRLLGGLFELADLGARALKGFGEPVRAWRVLGLSRVDGRFEARQEAASPTPLVGREQELALLLERFERAKKGQGQVVLVAGEPGIGKSRLVRALRERLGSEPHVHLRYKSSPHHQTSPLHPVIERLERAAGFQRDDMAPVRLAKLEALLARSNVAAVEAAPLIAALLSIPTGGRYPPLDLAPQRQKARTLQVLVEQLAGLAAERPALVVLEDAHWSDPSTVELFGLAVERAQRLPVLLVVTFRPEFQPPWLGQAHVTALTINRLGRRQGTALVERVTAGKALPVEVVEQIVAKTDGVPLFVEELTKTVLESGLLREESDRYTLAGALPPLAIPSTLQDSLMARLDRLAPVREVAQIGAAIGREFSYELLEAVAPLDEDELRAALNQFCESELVFCRGAPPAASYRFKHALVQDAAYQSLLKSKRQPLHARIAQVLEERFPEAVETKPEVLAHHCAQAGLAEKAAGYWHRAGQRALARSATAEAVAQLTRGLEMLGSLPESPQRDRRELDLQAALGGAQLTAKGWAAPATGRAYARARELCERLGEANQLFPVLWGLTVFHINRGAPGLGRQVAEEMLCLSERQDDAAVRVASHRALSAALFHLGELAPTKAHLERVLTLYEGLPDRPPPSLYAVDHRVMALAFLSRALFALGYPDQARARSREALAYAQELAHPHSLAFAVDQDALLHCTTHDWETVHVRAQALVTLSTEQGFSDGLALGTIIRGCALAALGRIQEGVALWYEGLAARATGHKVNPVYLGVLVEAHRKTGLYEEALRLLTEALERVERTDERWCEAELRRLKGEALLALSGRECAEAEGCFELALAVARKQEAKMWELRAATRLARLWRDQGKRDEAQKLLAPVYGWFTEGFDTPDLKEANALLADLGADAGNARPGLSLAQEVRVVAARLE